MHAIRCMSTHAHARDHAVARILIACPCTPMAMDERCGHERCGRESMQTCTRARASLAPLVVPAQPIVHLHLSEHLSASVLSSSSCPCPRAAHAHTHTHIHPSPSPIALAHRPCLRLAYAPAPTSQPTPTRPCPCPCRSARALAPALAHGRKHTPMPPPILLEEPTVVDRCVSVSGLMLYTTTCTAAGLACRHKFCLGGLLGRSVPACTCTCTYACICTSAMSMLVPACACACAVHVCHAPACHQLSLAGERRRAARALCTSRPCCGDGTLIKVMTRSSNEHGRS